MTTKRLDGWSSGTAPAPALASARGPILIELILEIVARSDVTTVIRFAGTTKFVRRAILGPAFRRRLALHGRFDPACLVAVSFMRHDVYRSGPAHRIFHTPSPTQHLVRMDTSSLSRSFKPVASRDGLLLLHQERVPSSSPELLVCNTFTGRITPLPPAAVRDTCLHVFLSAREGDGGLSYEYQLLVVGRDLRFQTFSSKHRKWGAVGKASTSQPLKIPGASSGSAAVIGRAVYWLCTLNASEDFFSYKIVALDTLCSEF